VVQRNNWWAYIEPRDLLCPSFHTLVMTEVQEPGAEMLHWAEKAYYKQKPKK